VKIHLKKCELLNGCTVQNAEKVVFNFFMVASPSANEKILLAFTYYL